MPSDHATKHYRFLDGLRGWAAVVVLFHHIFIDGLPANSVMADRALWAKVFLLSGSLAVSVFFVISGFSLSVCYLETGDQRSLARLAAGRYLRLALPILAVCTITYVLLSLEIIPPAAQRPSPLDVFALFTPTIKGLLSFSLLNVFVSYSDVETYNPPLWTMSYEFLGSFVVFAILVIMRSWRWRLRNWCLGALFILLAVCHTLFALFVAGILIADLFPHLIRTKSAETAGAALCATGLAVPFLLHSPFDLAELFGATCLTAGVAFFAPVRRLFENRVADFLGSISFPLYLVQAAVIYSFSLWGLEILASLGFEPSAQRWIIGATTVPVAIFFAIAFRPINEIAITLSRRFGSTLVTYCDQMYRPVAASRTVSIKVERN